MNPKSLSSRIAKMCKEGLIKKGDDGLWRLNRTANDD